MAPGGYKLDTTTMLAIHYAPRRELDQFVEVVARADSDPRRLPTVDGRPERLEDRPNPLATAVTAHLEHDESEDLRLTDGTLTEEHWSRLRPGAPEPGGQRQRGLPALAAGGRERRSRRRPVPRWPLSTDADHHEWRRTYFDSGHRGTVLGR